MGKRLRSLSPLGTGQARTPRGATDHPGGCTGWRWGAGTLGAPPRGWGTEERSQAQACVCVPGQQESSEQWGPLERGMGLTGGGRREPGPGRAEESIWRGSCPGPRK